MDQNHARYEVLDGMRGIAALTVMIHHFTQFGPRPLFQHAPVAVDLFFMLSGFVIMHSYGSRLRSGMPAMDYIKRRVIRLYPMFLIALFAGVLACMRQELPGYFSNSLWSVAFLNTVFIPFLDYTNTSRFALFSHQQPALVIVFEMLQPQLRRIVPVDKKQLGIFCGPVSAGLSALSFLSDHEHNLGSHAYRLGLPPVCCGFRPRAFRFCTRHVYLPDDG